jgi:hypothetical protein
LQLVKSPELEFRICEGFPTTAAEIAVAPK